MAHDIAAKLTEEQAGRLREQAIWAGLAASWPEAMLNPECARTVWTRLPEEAALTLGLILAGFGPAPFKEEQLLQAARPGIAAGADLRLGLLRLAEAGIVFPVRRGWGEKLFVLPPDSFFVWRRAIRSTRSPQPPEVDPLSVRPIDDEGYVPPFSLQLLHVMAAMGEAGLKLTAKGVLAKRTVAKAAEQLHVRGETLAPLLPPPAGAEAEAYPAGVLLALETMARQGWLVRSGQSLARDDAVWEAWLRLDAADRETALCRSLVEAIAARNGPAAAGAAALAALEAGKWFRLRDVDASHAAGQALLAKPQPSAIEPWCRLLRQLGWLELAADGAGEPAVRWRLDPLGLTDAPREEGGREPAEPAFGPPPVQLTPDGEMFAYEDCPYSVRWQLEGLAERRRTDHMTAYRLETHGYARAAGAGHTADSLAAAVEAMTGEPLPDTVRAMIRMGMDARTAAAGTVRDEAAGTARADAAGAARGDTPGAARAGLEPRGDTVPGAGGSASGPGEPKPVGAAFVYPPSGEGGYELLNERPSVKQLFAGIDEVPSMWLKQFRTYHHSTRRELLEQALSWRATVRLNCEGVATAFIPERIVDEADGWAVAGYRPDAEEPQTVTKLYPGMWDEMMLVLPPPLGVR
ncbi:hypothetical protein SAMN02799624_00187 [Paenibacillus sp. UNC496MF]|uniref:hypothetical protein n=1 Tax=Paenibacillus sp. UNC496MF TaxID=1502753 RepID=UPI0008ED9A0C|nr:hypothetical protein [Paenibacillus sp. UNC496MF]SFI29604.1 hypothetical protein SAMN02799624_00187 [Paenibacillus sp. UNC496MF]